LPHPLVLGKDKAYQKFLPMMAHKESYASKVNLDDDFDDFLTPTDILQSRAIVPHNE
jgi:hypothetical protein